MEFNWHSVSNWIEDLFWKQLDVTYPGMPDAMVTPLLKFLLMFRVLIELANSNTLCLLADCLSNVAGPSWVLFCIL
jgi:hypothetical protein